MNEEMTNMEMHGIGYITYAIGIHLAKYSDDFKDDEIDNEWDNRVYPWAVEFYNSPEYKDNIYDEPFMEALNRFINNKLNQ